MMLLVTSDEQQRRRRLLFHPRLRRLPLLQRLPLNKNFSPRRDSPRASTETPEVEPFEASQFFWKRSNVCKKRVREDEQTLSLSFSSPFRSLSLSASFSFLF